jgi:hypothetical protein
LKDEDEFARGAKQQEAFDDVKRYLSSLPVLRAPRRGSPFKLYVAAEDCVVGAVLIQETEGKGILSHMQVEDYWTPRRGILLLKSYAYHYIMLIPS